MRECECPKCGYRFVPGVDLNWVANIREKRMNAGLSQKQVAELLDLSPQYINDIERERRASPSPKIKDKWEAIVGWERQGRPRAVRRGKEAAR